MIYSSKERGRNMAGKKIGLVLALDGEKEFTQAVQNANKESKLFETQLKGISKEFEGNANSMEALQKKQEILTKTQEAYQRKLTAAKNGLDNANKQYREQSERLDELKKKLDEARKTQQKMEDAGEQGTDAYKKQTKTVDELTDAVGKQTLNQQKAAGRITDWNKRVYESETALKKSNNALEKNKNYLKEAEEATDHCATSIDAMGKEVKKTEQSLEKFGDTADEVAQVTTTLGDKVVSAFVSKGTSLAVDALTKGVEAVKESMYDTSGASAELAASTGASEAAMKKYNAVMKEIKGNNFGESYSDVAEAMGVVIQTMGELNDTDLQNVTENAMTLSDTFGYDYQEQMRAVDMLMKQFGITSQQAFNLIVQGTQQGLNKNGDLLDSINEYSVHYAQMGVSAEGFFNSLANGTDAGTFSVDKLGDAYKEFGIRVKDTATTTDEAYKILGLDADKMRTAFAEGGDSAAEATDIVLDALMNMDDKVKQNQAGVDLFGTMWEDLGIEGVKALTNLEGEISSTKSAMESLKEVRYSDLESAVSGFGAALQENIITPIADEALPAVTGLFEKATEVVQGIGEALAPQKTELEQFIDDIKASNEEVQTVIDNAQATMDGATADVSNLQAYKQVLMELNEQESLTEFQKYQLTNAVEALAGSVPGLSESFDAANGTLSITNEELSNLFDNAEAVAMQTALLDAQKQSYEALAQAAINKAKADSAVATAQKESADASEKNLKSMQETGSAYGEFYREELDAQIALDDAVKVQKEANEAYEEAQKQIDTESKALEDLNKQYGLISDASAKASGAIEETGTAADDAAQKFDEYGNNITNMTDEQVAAVAEASKEIVEAYENMREGIKSSIEGSISLFDEFSGGTKTSASDMISNLDSQIDGITKWKENMETLAGELGNGMSQELYDKLAEMGPESANAVQALVDALESETGQFEEISQKWTEALQLKEDAANIADFTSAGQDAANQYAAGMLEGTTATTEAAQQVAQAGAEAVQQETPQFKAAGTDSAENYTNALKSALSQAAQAGGQLASAARNALASYQNSFYNTGYNMAAGVASGIRGGQSGAISAAVNMARQALQAAKNELEIRSPSKKFRKEVGQNISESTAFGINDKASLAGKAASKMSNKVYTNAVSWLSKYKKKQQVSLADEKWYWQQVLEHTKKGTSAYNKALKKIQNINISELTASGVSSAAASKITKNFGVSKTTGSGKKKKTKDAETYYSEIYSAAEKYLSNQQVLNDWSLQQELAYWNAVKGQLKKGSQAWYDATKQINSLQADIAAAEAKAAEEKVKTHANVQKDILDKYKVYYKVSAKAEMDYWNLARQQFKKGTDERIEADQNYLEACQEYYDQRKELDEEYAENSKDINEDLTKNIQDLQDAYHDSVQSRKQDILSSMNLFESWDASGYDSDTLLYNLKTQVAGLALWEQQLEELGKKGLSDALMEELSAMGPDAAANIYSLNQMTAEQLDEYNKLWEQKNALAQSQALKDNEDLLKETNAEITTLRTEAQAELNALNADYRAALQELNTGISSELKNLVSKSGSIGEDAVSSLISGIEKEATSVDTYNSTTKVVDNISSQFATLKQEGQTIGKETLDSMLAELTNGAKITAAAQSAAQSIKQAMQQEFAAQQAAMLELNSIGNGGITMLNDMTREYGAAQTIVNVDNNGVMAAMNQVSAGLQTLIELIANSKLIMYPDVVAGELQPYMDKENASVAIQRNRGRY